MMVFSVDFLHFLRSLSCGFNSMHQNCKLSIKKKTYLLLCDYELGAHTHYACITELMEHIIQLTKRNIKHHYYHLKMHCIET